MSNARPDLKAAMRHNSFAALIVSLALTQAGHAATRDAAPEPRTERSAPAAAEQSPFLGKWALDLARMPATYGPPPKGVTFAFADAGAGQWRTTIEITAPDGSVRRMASTYRRDGKAVQAEGDQDEADRAAFASPAANVLVVNLAKGGVPASVRVYTVSPDGREMTESAADVDGDGAPFVRTFHFKRVS